jgi:hypothetical protein
MKKGVRYSTADNTVHELLEIERTFDLIVNLLLVAPAVVHYIPFVDHGHRPPPCIYETKRQ